MTFCQARQPRPQQLSPALRQALCMEKLLAGSCGGQRGTLTFCQTRQPRPQQLSPPLRQALCM